MIEALLCDGMIMRKAITFSNAKHEAGHWITGWILEKASKDLVIATTNNGDSYCERNPHPDFVDLEQINSHLGNRIINLLSGAKSESLVCGEFNNEIYIHLIGDYKGAWPDYFMASELFRYYYRSLNPSCRKSFDEEWNLITKKTEEIIKQHELFINSVANEAIRRISGEQSLINFSQADMLNILENHSKGSLTECH
ncbi:hypothetical protein [Citrobacter freundii]|uniref:hypothetical protein n=1 Tax=Citrobacter freundii TaxID=546 RepID=UPI00221EC027|nr:hypothetical protein [Citrobacter freundii]ELT3492672.1 hypothetical protein [Citrobacter freundii]MCW0941843.1 hypothetical protein [Citrobacter freundii]MDT7310401.1 hypothetical protein [Citrobacter freundii]MDV2189969.1 hypothetical protein [Citrobacter freundii]MEB0532248.1 hypothetical protein [Citrobacter freundii]